MPVIRIDDDVWRELQLRAEGLKDRPNTILRRVLKIDTDSTRGTGTTLFELFQLYLVETSRAQRRDVLDEIRRRFVTFGWLDNFIKRPEA